mgnify:CR=1 FL=1
MAFTEKKKLLELSPDKIVPNPAQPRLDFPQDEPVSYTHLTLPTIA